MVVLQTEVLELLHDFARVPGFVVGPTVYASEHQIGLFIVAIP